MTRPRAGQRKSALGFCGTVPVVSLASLAGADAAASCFGATVGAGLTGSGFGCAAIFWGFAASTGFTGCASTRATFSGFCGAAGFCAVSTLIGAGFAAVCWPGRTCAFASALITALVSGLDA